MFNLRSHRAMGMAAAILAASLSGLPGTQLAAPVSLSKLPLPPYLRDLDRRQRRKMAMRAQRRLQNAVNRQSNLYKSRRERQKEDKDKVKARRLINSMSNWQRTRWQKESKAKDLKTLHYYATLPHWKVAA